jgi:hypothetical protein
LDLFSDTFDLDVELSKDASGACLKQVQDVVQQGLSSVRREMDRGLSGVDFKKAEALRKSYEAASTAVAGVWNGFHNR